MTWKQFCNKYVPQIIGTLFCMACIALFLAIIIFCVRAILIMVGVM
jgi:hypothetical protein